MEMQNQALNHRKQDQDDTGETRPARLLRDRSEIREACCIAGALCCIPITMLVLENLMKNEQGGQADSGV